MSRRRTMAMARKEFLHILRDPRSLIMAVAIPFLLLLLFGFALSLDVDRIPLLVLDRDRTPASRELIARFDGSRYFEVRGAAASYAELTAAIDRSEVLACLVLPRGFARSLLRGETAPVQLLVDGSDSNTAAIAVGYAESLTAAYSASLTLAALERRTGRRPAPAVDTRLRIWYNETLESKNYIVPGLIAVILQIIAALLTSLTIAREWEMGTMEQLLATPVRPAEIVLGKMLAFFAVGATDALLAIGLGVWVFQVPLRGSVLLLMASTAVFLAGALCWGILLSAIARSQVLAFQLGILSSFLPAFLLSGFVFAIENMPVVVQAVTHIVPARYFVALLKGVYLKGVGLEILGLQLALLGVYALAVFFAATRKVGRRFA